MCERTSTDSLHKHKRAGNDYAYIQNDLSNINVEMDVSNSRDCQVRNFIILDSGVATMQE